MIGPGDRAPLAGDTDDLRTALAMLKAMRARDLEGLQVLSRYTDPFELHFGFAEIVIDALGEPSTTDLAGYMERLFERLDRGQGR
jgi:hypothetical protein